MCDKKKESAKAMSEHTYKIIGDAKIVWFKPTPNRIFNTDEKGSPLLKRRAPRRPPYAPAPKQRDDKPESDSD